MTIIYLEGGTVLEEKEEEEEDEEEDEEEEGLVLCQAKMFQYLVMPMGPVPCHANCSRVLSCHF